MGIRADLAIIEGLAIVKVMSLKTYYNCPLCGKRVVLGQHFCSGTAEIKPIQDTAEQKNKKRNRDRAKDLAWAAIASLLLMILLWQSIGIYSLVALLLVPIVIAANLVGRRPRKKRDSPEYLELLMLCGRDRGTAERLIRAESKRAPGKPDRANRDTWVRAAKERLERDLRRSY